MAIKSARALERPATPILKWAGGKGRLLEQYTPLFPKTFNRYFEAFLGGGAVFFRLSSGDQPLRATLSDNNGELINCYKMVKENVEAVLTELQTMHNDKSFFYKVRALDPSELTDVERAARLIFLNKTCFNGLYRENSKGQFNVPFGKYKNPKIADGDNLRAASKAFAKTTLLHAPFEKVLSRAKSGDFVYLDPPYQPLSKTANFTAYTRNSFSFQDQERLAEVAAALDRKGVLVMLSNSDTPEVRELYQAFSISTVRAGRAINCRGDRRGSISELVIRNYE